MGTVQAGAGRGHTSPGAGRGAPLSAARPASRGASAGQGERKRERERAAARAAAASAATASAGNGNGNGNGDADEDDAFVLDDEAMLRAMDAFEGDDGVPLEVDAAPAECESTTPKSTKQAGDSRRSARPRRCRTYSHRRPPKVDFTKWKLS